MIADAKLPESPSPPPRPLFQRLREIPVPTQRLLAWLLLVLAGFSLVPWPRGKDTGGAQLGMIQPTTVIADFDFPILKDPTELEREREDQAGTVAAVLVRADTASAGAFARLASVRERVHTLRLARSRGGRGSPQEVVLPFSQPTLIALMVGDQSGALLDQAAGLLRDVMQRGFVTPDLASQLVDYKQVKIRDPLGETIVPTDQLLTVDRVGELARGRAGARGIPAEALAELTLQCAVPNLLYDAASTSELVRKAKEGVDPWVGLVLKGEKIIGAHDRITSERLRVLRSYDYWRQQRGVHPTLLTRFLPTAGRVLLVLLALGVFALYLAVNRPDLLVHPHNFWLLASVEAFVLFLAAVFIRTLQLPAVLVPVGAVAILITLLFDDRLALAASALPVLLISVVGDGGTLFLAVIGLGTVVTTLLTHAVRQRSQFFRLLALVPLVHLVTLAALYLAESAPLASLLREGAAVAANPILAAALSLFALPFIESAFGHCTDITLLEFSDLNRPLLRRLMMSAPGTYHHSILVGALAESAAQAISAHLLLARVIGYYHDIGKVAKPEYFIENVSLGMKNPHDRLSPSMSRLILESHLREGIALAKEDKLPREVVRGIREHHGTSIMPQPWRKARRLDPQSRVQDYCYPGPRPSGRESALVLLADQVESAARTLEDPTPSRIKGVVFRVVQENLESGNLDESGLTLSDLARVRDAFVPMLAAAFRGRVQGDRGADDAVPRETLSRRTPLPRNPR